MQALVLDLWRAHAPSVLLVTHDVDEALLLADRAVVLEKGRIVAQIFVEGSRPRDPSSRSFSAQRRELLTLLGVPLSIPDESPSTLAWSAS
jgi:sulfonate transport system ATP-binding protein